jgi:class 3 adenylate cyclase/tetratricopeptide (TPR) repeat protein
VATCPSCSKENPEGFRFCGFCSAALETGRETAGEERKVVTILFCDLVGFTAASESTDPEDVRARIRPYHELLRAEIERFGGTVEKFIGDAVMAVFGAPIAHEDDSERAVRSGLRILEAIEDLNEADPAFELRVRIGINTGEGLVALDARPELGEGMVTGDVVNTASRLQGVAPVNGVGVGEATYLATKDIFEYEELQPAELKGKAEPVRLFHAKAARARFGTDLTRGHTTPLVGREIDLALLKGIFEKALAVPGVQLVTIVGEPGVGKSRLVAELGAYIDERPDLLIRWRQGRCLPYGDGITFWALGEIVKAEAGILENDDPETAARRIDEIVADTDPDAPWLRQRLRPLVGIEAPTAAREENFAAWRRFLESLADDSPTVLVFEDLHWADDSLLELLEQVVEYAHGVPLVLVGTARPELFERTAGWGTRLRNATTIDLAPLTETETGKLISNLLEQAVLPAEVQTAILERSGGNPLYAEEFVRLLKDRGSLSKASGTWRLDPAAEVPMPSGVQGLIAARLDALEPEKKSLLQDAAVLGKVFWSGALAAMGGRNRDAVERGLHELARRELVRPARRSSMEGETEHAFLHALVRDVAYGQIPRAARADKHVAAARWIEEAAGERAEDHAEILAAHFESAIELAKASGASDTADLDAAAVRYLGLAGDRASGLDTEAAERNYARALDLTGPDDERRPGLLVRYAEALRSRARPAESVTALEEAIAGFRSSGDDRSLGVALGQYGLVLSDAGDPRSRKAADDGLGILEPLGPSSELVAALTEVAAERVVTENDPRVGLEAAETAIEMASRLGLPDAARAIGFRGIARLHLGEESGLDDLSRAIELATTQGRGREVVLLYHNLADCQLILEGPQRAIETHRQGLSLARDRGIEDYILSLRQAIVRRLENLGAWDEALVEAEQLDPLMESAGIVYDLVLLRAYHGRIVSFRGDHERAQPLVRWALERARTSGEQQLIGTCLPVAASVLSAMGDARSAFELLQEFQAEPTAWVLEDSPLQLPESVRVALATGGQDLAGRLVDGVRLDYPLHRHALASSRALIAENRGELEAAERDFAAAAASWAAFEIPYEHAQSMLGRGRCLIALGRVDDARVSLREATEIFARLGAAPARREAEALVDGGIAQTS